jgi:isoquinoline 1-oxidoreductase beta subunit
MLLSLYMDPHALAQDAATPPTAFPPDAFVHVMPDGRIVIKVNYIELGQGVHTSLPIILADEMDADWSQVVAELAPAADIYKDPVFGVQVTGDSAAIANSFQRYRELGASARAMMVAAAAERWHASADQCRTANSVVYGPTGQSACYAELASDAARRPVPDKTRLKEASDFKLIGKGVRRLDSRAKCDGSQKFGLDLDIPGMKVAVLARPPVFGGVVKVIDDKAARNIAGVHDVFAIPLVHGSAVAVVADRFWTAKQARDQLKIEWDLSQVDTRTVQSCSKSISNWRAPSAMSRLAVATKRQWMASRSPNGSLPNVSFLISPTRPWSPSTPPSGSMARVRKHGLAPSGRPGTWPPSLRSWD